jgi:hypothetical protein
MKTVVSLLAFCLMALPPVARAREYPLQFKAPAGYQGLVVAGYEFVGKTVVGNCSYYTVSSGSGRAGGYHPSAKSYRQTCTWDLYGELLSVRAGAPAVPAPLSVKGTRTVYAANANGGYTGRDRKLPRGGFVDTPSPHYSWLAANTDTVVQERVSTHSATLKSDGEEPVNISVLDVSALKGIAHLESTTCTGVIKVGSSCVIDVIYDSGRLSPMSGPVHDTIRIEVKSDSDDGQEFFQDLTVVAPKEADE